MYFCGWGCVLGGGYICVYGLECVRRVEMYWEGRREDNLHNYIIFVTVSSLVHEKKFYPINLIKMTKIENKNFKCSK